MSFRWSFEKFKMSARLLLLSKQGSCFDMIFAGNREGQSFGDWGLGIGDWGLAATGVAEGRERSRQLPVSLSQRREFIRLIRSRGNQ
jgi:hypothetical protein